jgi:glutathione synthase/RimK-type ligase-like ATP-grasp enzyme
LALAIEAAQRLGLDQVVFNQRHAQFCDIAVDSHRGTLAGALRISDREWRLEDFTGVYTRLIDVHSLPENRPRRYTKPDDVAILKSSFLHQTLADWMEIAECRVVNRAAAMSSNVSKPYQAQIISKFFSVPATLVTNDPGAALEFIQLHGRVIYKSISSIRSIVREWSAADEPSLHKIRSLPTQFQSYVEGTNIRVHVVGSRIFATEIISTAVDYRYATRDELEVEMVETELPLEIADKCVGLSMELQLPFCGIDLKRRPDGRYYCFEVNPSPAYSYYQETTGQPIADALVKYLAGRTEVDHECSSC